MSLLDLIDEERTPVPENNVTLVPENNVTPVPENNVTPQPNYDEMLGRIDGIDREPVSNVHINYSPQPTFAQQNEDLINAPTNQVYDPVSGKKQLPYKGGELNHDIINFLISNQRKVGDISADDEKLMATFNDAVMSKKHTTYEGLLNAVAKAGYNPARIRQLTEPSATEVSEYWDRYGLARDVDAIEYGAKKLWYGTQEFLGMDLDTEQKATLEDARKGADAIHASGSYLTHVFQAIPEMAVSYPMWQVKTGAGLLGVVSSALANAMYQGTITGGAIQGETENRAQATGWALGIGAVIGTVSLTPLLGMHVDNLARKFMSTYTTPEEMKQARLALDIVEDTSKLSDLQKDILAFSKTNPEGAEGLSQALVRSPEARKNFIETIKKKHKASNLGMEITPHERWSQIHNMVKEQEAYYTSTQNEITKQLGKLKVPSTELGIDMRHLEFDSSLTEKWLPFDTQTLEKMKLGKSVSLEEMQSFRRAAAQQGTILIDEGAKQLGQQFVKLSKDIDKNAIPKILESGALPKEALLIQQGYQKAIEGYASMNNLLRTSLGKKLLDKTTEEELQAAVRKASLSKGMDLTSEAQDYVAAIKKINPNAVPAVEQTILKDLVQSSRSNISDINKARTINWNEVARDLDHLNVTAFTSPEGKSAFIVLKNIADVSQTDFALLRETFKELPTSHLEAMGHTALGFSPKLVSLRKAWTEATKYFHSPTAFSHSLEKAMGVKGSNLSEVLYSMQSVGIVPKGEGAQKGFKKAVELLGKIQADVNKERNMKFLSYAGEGPISVDGKQFNEVGDLLDAGLLKVNQGDNVAVNSQGKTALILSDDVQITNVGELARLEEGDSMLLDEILDAPKLYEEHPYLKNIKVIPFNQAYNKGIVMGSTDTDKGIINLNMHKDALTKDFVGAIMHEVGHNVNTVMGVPPATTTGNLKRIVAEKYGGDMNSFLDDLGAPPELTSYHQLYQSQIDEQFADMNAKGATGNINFSAMDMSEKIGDLSEDLGPRIPTEHPFKSIDERRYLRSKGFKEQAIEEMMK